MKKIIIALIAALSATAAFAVDTPKPDASVSKLFIYTANPYDIVIGKKDAPVTVVEYASLSCPHCGHFFNELFPKFKEKYIDAGKVKLIYRHYPLNAPAMKAAMLVECADKDRQHDFLRVLFKMQDKWAYVPTYMDSLGNIAALGGIGKERFNACMNDKSIEQEIANGEKQAAELYKVSSTPSFFVSGSVAPATSDPDAVNKAVDAELARIAKK